MILLPTTMSNEDCWRAFSHCKQNQDQRLKCFWWRNKRTCSLSDQERLRWADRTCRPRSAILFGRRRIVSLIRRYCFKAWDVWWWDRKNVQFTSWNILDSGRRTSHVNRTSFMIFRSQSRIFKARGVVNAWSNQILWSVRQAELDDESDILHRIATPLRADDLSLDALKYC